MFRQSGIARHAPENRLAWLENLNGSVPVGSIDRCQRLLAIHSSELPENRTEVREQPRDLVTLRHTLGHAERSQFGIRVGNDRMRTGQVMSREPMSPLRCGMLDILNHRHKAGPLLRMGFSHGLHQNQLVTHHCLMIPLAEALVPRRKSRTQDMLGVTNG